MTIDNKCYVKGRLSDGTTCKDIQFFGRNNCLADEGRRLACMHSRKDNASVEIQHIEDLKRAVMKYKKNGTAKNQLAMFDYVEKLE